MESGYPFHTGGATCIGEFYVVFFVDDTVSNGL